MEFKKRYLLALIPLIIVLSILYYFSDIVTYVVLAWVLSLIGAPVTRKLRKYLGKTLSALITLFLFVLGFTMLIYIFIPPLVQQARNLAGIDYEEIALKLEEPISDWENWLQEKGLIERTEPIIAEDTTESTEEPLVISRTVRIDSLIQSGGDTLNNTNISLVINIQNPHDHEDDQAKATEVHITDSFFDRLRKNLISLVDPSMIPEIFSSVVGFLGNILITIMSVLFIAFFFLKEQGLFNKAVESILPDRFAKQSNHAIEETTRLLIRYFTGILFQITVITLYVSIALSVLGVESALLIGFFAALMNVIPYIGPIIGAMFGIVITIASFADPTLHDPLMQISFYSDILPTIIKVIIVFVTMQLMDNFALQPTIFGKSVKAHPLEIFIVVMVGAKLGGIPGMVLAIPIYTVIRVIAKVFLSEFKVVKSLTRSLEE